MAVGLRLGDDYFERLASGLADTRDRLHAGLHAAGFTVYPSEATYFTTVDVTGLRNDGDGMAFCLDLPHRVGVVAVPNQVFYVDPERGRSLVRFACCKRPEVIDAAVERLVTLAN
jgi:N-succinyldiaminopimelate aminotransferase